MSRNVQRAMERIGSSIITLAGGGIAFCGVCIAGGALLFAISPSTFFTVGEYLPKAIQDRLAMDFLALAFMGNLWLALLCAIGVGVFLVRAGHNIVTR